MNRYSLPVPQPAPCILLIDDHTLFRTGMRLIVQSFEGMGKVLEAGSVMEARMHEALPVQVVLLDIQMPGLNGLDGLAVLQPMFKGAKFIFVSASASTEAIQETYARGAAGFLPKSASADDILSAIRTVLQGGKCFPFAIDNNNSAQAAGSSRQSRVPALSARQMQALALLAQGMPNKVIAREMGLSENTVRVHVSAMFAHFGVNSRTAAVLAAQQAGLLRV